MTILDQTHAAMEAGGEAEALAFWRSLADAELFLVLEEEATGEVMTPRVYDLAEGPLLLAFDSEERLATISDDPMPYAVLPGRVLAAQLAGQGLGLGLNLGTACPSETILPPEAIDWLAEMLSQTDPEEAEARIAALAAPHLPQGLLTALGGLLPSGAAAALAQVTYQGGGQGHMLVLSGIRPEAEARMARAVAEALVFSGLEAAALDLAFAGAETALFLRISGAGLTVSAAEVVPPPMPEPPQAPGSDPDKPPRLR